MDRSLLREKLYKGLHEKNAIQRQIARRLFLPLQAMGFHLTADHFYDSVPNTEVVRATYPEGPRECLWIDFNYEQAETRFLQRLQKYAPELVSGALSSCGFENQNAYFSDLDSVALYMEIRQSKPQTIVEVGQGMSTKIIAAACRSNWTETGRRTALITIDPYARVEESKMRDAWIDIDVIRKPVQTADVSVFQTLKENDLLFVDSSHVYKFGSDVEYEFNGIYPTLSENVLIHIHDIFSPYEYPKHWLVNRKQFWNEQYYLEQFLRFNSRYEVILPLHTLSRGSRLIQDFVAQHLSAMGISTTGQSFYMRRVAA